mmetsp:Transcript_1996/g.3948  ORF Transcript_1996/g.3948 Transcript_1996/m.3948 type:complete len:434 (+) Transcript_1996:255-1556(+)
MASRFKYPVAVTGGVESEGAVLDNKESQMQAVVLYHKLKEELEETTFKCILNYRRTRKGVILFETGSPQHQLRVQSELKAAIRVILPEFDGSILAYGAQARKDLVAKGVPTDVSDESLVNSNLGAIDPATVIRLPTYFGKKKEKSTTVMFSATSDEDAERLLATGVKAGNLLIKDVSVKLRLPPVCYICGCIGHVAKNCGEDIAKKIDFSSNAEKDQYCYQCKKFGHRFRECAEELTKYCVNCKAEGHWPTDWGKCPMRGGSTHKEGSSAKTSSESTKTYKEAILTKDMQAQKVRMHNMEKRVTKCEEHDRMQAEALHTTRLVLGDVALVSRKKKKTLTRASKREITSWYEYERMRMDTKKQQNRADKANKETKKTPTKDQRRRTRSSLEAVRPEKKATQPLRFDASLLEGLEEEQESQDDMEDTSLASSYAE